MVITLCIVAYVVFLQWNNSGHRPLLCIKLHTVACWWSSIGYRSPYAL